MGSNMDPAEHIDDEAWHKKEGVPHFEDEFIQRYLDGRDALIDQENKMRSDYVFRQNMSPIAMEAAEIVDAIRQRELVEIWQSDRSLSLSDNQDKQPVYPGMPFALAKERIEQSKLFKIVRKMPKGALLHCHFEAMISIESILEDAFAMQGIYLKSPKPLNTETARRIEDVYFDHVDDGEEAPSKASASLWSADYLSESCVPLNEAADSFPDGGRSGFIQWMKYRTSIEPNESTEPSRGLTAVWARFLSTFGTLRTIVYHLPILRKFIWRFCQQLHADQVEWADVRLIIFDPKYTLEEQPFLKVLQVFQDVVEEFKSSEEGKGFWGLRLIWTWPRGLGNRSVHYAMKQCIEAKLAYPDIIAGFDLVGYENAGRPLAEHTPEIFWFRKACVETGVTIPFFFHAAETTDTGTEVDENLFDAILLGSRRIGHAFALHKHPVAVDMVKEKKILVECCPISNEVLRFTGGIKQHPLPALIARGVTACLSNDDTAVLGYPDAGLSYDYYQAIGGWDSLGLAGLGSLAENSVKYAAFEDEDNKTWLQNIKDGAYGKSIKSDRMQEWMKAWEGFCLWIVSEFGEELNEEVEDGPLDEVD